MRSTKTTRLPGPLGRARQRLESWRRSRRGRAIPEPLWAEAVELSRSYGVHRTARALRLNYYSLRSRVEAEPGEEEAKPTFLELVSPVAGASAECLVELENGRGGKMRIHVRGGELPDLSALTVNFWREKA